MEKFETNSLLIINFFKKNYIKMIIFVTVSISISLSLTILNNKKFDLFYSKFQVVFNKGTVAYHEINIGNLNQDFLFFLEKKGFRNNKNLTNKHKSNIIQLEIKHKNLNDKATKQYDEYVNLVKIYKEKLLSKLDSYENKYIEQTNREIASMEKETIAEVYDQRVKYLTHVEEIRKTIIADELFYVLYNGLIHSRKVNNLLKIATITLCISIIVILLILWIKILSREIKKNS